MNGPGQRGRPPPLTGRPTRPPYRTDRCHPQNGRVRPRGEGVRAVPLLAPALVGLTVFGIAPTLLSVLWGGTDKSLVRAGVDPATLADTDGVLAAADRVRGAASGVTAVDLPTGQQFGYWWPWGAAAGRAPHAGVLRRGGAAAPGRYPRLSPGRPGGSQSGRSGIPLAPPSGRTARTWCTWTRPASKLRAEPAR